MRFTQPLHSSRCLQPTLQPAALPIPPQVARQPSLLVRRMARLPAAQQPLLLLRLLPTLTEAAEGAAAPAAAAAAAPAAATPMGQGWRRLGSHVFRHDAFMVANNTMQRETCSSAQHEYGADMVPLLMWQAQQTDGIWPGGGGTQQQAEHCLQQLCQWRLGERLMVSAVRQLTPGWPHLPEGLPLPGLQTPPPRDYEFSAHDLQLDIEHPLSQLLAPGEGYHRPDGMGLMAS